MGSVLRKHLWRVYCRVQTHLHAVSDALAVGQELRQVLGSEDIPEGGLSQQAGGEVSVDHVGHRRNGVTDTEVNHSIHRNRNRILGQDLGRGGIIVSKWEALLKDYDQQSHRLGLNQVLPLGAGCQRTPFAGQLSRRNQCRAKWRKFLQKESIFKVYWSLELL